MSSSKILIKIICKDSNNEVYFKVNNDIKFSKVFLKYGDRFNISDVSSLRFLYMNQVINGKSTPKKLKMKEGDEIEVITEQTGG